MSFIALIAILLGTILVVRWLRQRRRRPPATPNSRRTLWLAAAGGAALLLLAGSSSGGRSLLLLTPIAVLLPLLFRRRSTSPGTPPAHVVETSWFRALEANGLMPMDAVVTAGSYAGRRLSELALSDLIWLHQQIDDTASLDLLEHFLDREFPGWKGRARSSAELVSADMTPARAREILGLDATATQQEVVGAHRRLIQRLHPDRGGSGYLATLLNRAKEILLENEKR